MRVYIANVRIGTCSWRQHLRNRLPPLVFPHVPRLQEALAEEEKRGRVRARATGWRLLCMIAYTYACVLSSHYVLKYLCNSVHM